MGLQEREDMRERRRRDLDSLSKEAERPFAPPGEGASFFLPLVAVGLAAFGLVKGFGWWQDSQVPSGHASAVLVQHLETERPPLPLAPQHPPQAIAASAETGGIRIAEQQRREAVVAAPVAVVSAPPADPALNLKLVCAALDQHVIDLDARARQPQSGQMQEWIRSERQKARDEQFRRHC